MLGSRTHGWDAKTTRRMRESAKDGTDGECNNYVFFSVSSVTHDASVRVRVSVYVYVCVRV